MVYLERNINLRILNTAVQKENSSMHTPTQQSDSRRACWNYLRNLKAFFYTTWISKGILRYFNLNPIQKKPQCVYRAFSIHPSICDSFEWWVLLTRTTTNVFAWSVQALTSQELYKMCSLPIQARCESIKRPLFF